MAKQKKRKDGRYSSNFTFKGKRYFVYGKSASELKENELKKRQEIMEGMEDRENPTLNRYYETFVEMRRGKTKESTIRSHAIRFRNCAEIEVEKGGRTLGELRIREITPKDMQLVQQKLQETKLNTNTINNCLDHLKHVFYCAIKDETINRNPCDCLEHIQRTEKPARETIHRALSVDETEKFFSYAEESFYYNYFALMIQTGLRVGELGALMETDIDEKAGVIHIRRTVSRNEEGGYYIADSTKTVSGVRDIPLNDTIRAIIKNQKQLNREWYKDKIANILFRSFEGEVLREYTVNREIKRICKRAGIEKFTCHAFRSTFATRFIEQRPQDYKVLSEILGHSKTDITLDLYTHAMKETKVEAMNNLTIAI